VMDSRISPHMRRTSCWRKSFSISAPIPAYCAVLR
jgi:hypothetical protein